MLSDLEGFENLFDDTIFDEDWYNSLNPVAQQEAVIQKVFIQVGDKVKQRFKCGLKSDHTCQSLFASRQVIERHIQTSKDNMQAKKNETVEKAINCLISGKKKRQSNAQIK